MAQQTKATVGGREFSLSLLTFGQLRRNLKAMEAIGTVMPGQPPNAEHFDAMVELLASAVQAQAANNMSAPDFVTFVDALDYDDAMNDILPAFLSLVKRSAPAGEATGPTATSSTPSPTLNGPSVSSSA